MITGKPLRLAILYPGNRADRDHANPVDSRFLAVFKAFGSAGVSAEPAVYHDDFRDEVRQQLAQVAGVLVWHNPIEGGRDRSLLDGMLREVAANGVMVSTHPDTILKLGTKDVLLSVRDLPFGTDTHRVDSLSELQTLVLARVAVGARVLKQQRGHSGIGVWRIERRGAAHYAAVEVAPYQLPPFCKSLVLCEFVGRGARRFQRKWSTPDRTERATGRRLKNHPLLANCSPGCSPGGKKRKTGCNKPAATR